MTLGNSQVILLSVAEFAEISSTTPRTIRFYEKAGLIKPAKIDRWNNYRYYFPEQTRIIAQIKLLQNFDIPLKEVKKLIHGREAYLSLRAHLQKMKEEITQKQQKIEMLETLNETIFEGEQLKKYFKPEKVGSYQLFCLTVNKGSYNKIPEYIDQVRQTAKQLKIDIQDSEITFFVDSEYKPRNSNLKVAVIYKNNVNKRINLPENYSFENFPKTKCLVFNYKGSYKFLTAIYKSLDQYIENNNIKINGAVFEQYLKSELNTNSEYQYITKICYPI